MQFQGKKPDLTRPLNTTLLSQYTKTSEFGFNLVSLSKEKRNMRWTPSMLTEDFLASSNTWSLGKVTFMPRILGNSSHTLAMLILFYRLTNSSDQRISL